jgi:hypothetical protein
LRYRLGTGSILSVALPGRGGVRAWRGGRGRERATGRRVDKQAEGVLLMAAQALAKTVIGNIGLYYV